MRSKTRLITISILICLSVIGGLVGHSLNDDIGFAVGIIGTYLFLVTILIVTGKVELKL